MKVTKFSGEIVSFDKTKLQRSLQKSGADDNVVLQVLHEIERELYEGIPTKKIYKLAFQLLKNFSNVHAARYNLRTAIQALGPAGFFFEKFIGKLFELEGYQVQTNLILQGKCISHEVDVLLKKENTISMIECKFHGSQDAKTDVKVPLYILSRFNDLKEIPFSIFNANHKISHCWIATNNRFTEDAINFGTCSHLQLLSWDYPRENSLKHKIDVYQLYPVTCLTTLTAVEKDRLLIQDIITVKDLLQHSDWLSKIGLSTNRIKNILKEANQLCNLIQ
ncbi:ATP cone domain-containing protein [Flavobacterium lacus]|uniref:Restriction endonuclease n=1 Tax=Flavobacterium lacus TaxID=1353778 RepID=A0A328WX34_9FLAO|nr:ATP cone domain-containing protein [Flavobacterium lacus]RAR47858.1 restriction endonuclease [Flavobacterium lacus]